MSRSRLEGELLLELHTAVDRLSNTSKHVLACSPWLTIYHVLATSWSPIESSNNYVQLHNAQASTTGQQTLTLEDADAFTGAILFATFSINNFSFQSIEEYNTVDYWTVMGAGGGILGELCFCCCVVVVDDDMMLTSSSHGRNLCNDPS